MTPLEKQQLYAAYTLRPDHHVKLEVPDLAKEWMIAELVAWQQANNKEDWQKPCQEEKDWHIYRDDTKKKNRHVSCVNQACTMIAWVCNHSHTLNLGTWTRG